jgi:hypothetical protein
VSDEEIRQYVRAKGAGGEVPQLINCSGGWELPPLGVLIGEDPDNG